MKKPKLLVLGATGFIGRNMVEYFSASGQYEVHAVGFNSPQYYIDGVHWHTIDLRERWKVDALMNGMRDLSNIDVLIQAAAVTSGSKDITERPYLHVTDNAVMNSHIFRSAFEHKVKHVIFFSCTTMYESSHVPQSEDVEIKINPKYFGVAHTKLYLEKMCEFYSKLGSTKFTAIRHSNIYGPHDKYDLEKSHVFGAMIRKVMDATDNVTVWGNGTEARDFLHVDDLTDFVERVIEKQPYKYGLYNCGSGLATSVSDLVLKIIKASRKKLSINYDTAKPTIPTNVALDCYLAEDDLGWKPQINIDDGIARTLEWYRGNI